MKAYGISMFVVSDVEKMAAKSLCYCVLGLSNVLFTAGFAGNTVNEGGTLAMMLCLQGCFQPVVVQMNLPSLCNWLMC